ncbi:MAG: hypothetical protein ACQEQL_05915 [Pseudomonadota bacterium]
MHFKMKNLIIVSVLILITALFVVDIESFSLNNGKTLKSEKRPEGFWGNEHVFYYNEGEKPYLSLISLNDGGQEDRPLPDTVNFLVAGTSDEISKVFDGSLIGRSNWCIDHKDNLLIYPVNSTRISAYESFPQLKSSFKFAYINWKKQQIDIGVSPRKVNYNKHFSPILDRHSCQIVLFDNQKELCSQDISYTHCIEQTNLPSTILDYEYARDISFAYNNQFIAAYRDEKNTTLHLMKRDGSLKTFKGDYLPRLRSRHYDQETGKNIYYYANQALSPKNWPLKVDIQDDKEQDFVETIFLPKGPFVGKDGFLDSFKCFSCGCSCYRSLTLSYTKGTFYAAITGKTAFNNSQGIYRLNKENKWEKIVKIKPPKTTAAQYAMFSPKGCNVVWNEYDKENETIFKYANLCKPRD